MFENPTQNATSTSASLYAKLHAVPLCASERFLRAGMTAALIASASGTEGAAVAVHLAAKRTSSPAQVRIRKIAKKLCKRILF
jgi:hypothetical protein